MDDKMRELLAICQVHRIPMFASAAVSNSEDKTEYQNIIYTAQAHDLGLADDHIRKYMLVARGFEAVPPRENVTFGMEDLAPLSNDTEEDDDDWN